MAGKGKRFLDAGIQRPKYDIIARNKSLLEWSLSSLKYFNKEEFIFIFQKKHKPEASIKKVALKHKIKNYKFVPINYLTDGQASTAILASKHCEKNKKIIIYNIDTYVEPKYLKPYYIKGDGWVPSFKASGTHWSFVKIDHDQKISNIKEKERISNLATIGLYYFRSFSLFEKSYYATKTRKGTEKYVASLYQYLIKNNHSVYTHIIPSSKVHVLGTPEDINEFDKNYYRLNT